MAQAHRQMVSALLWCMALAWLASQHATARYLPTRADGTDVEVLKDLIRGLMVQSSIESPQVESQLGHKWMTRQARAMEMPVTSDGDPYLAPALMLADPSQRHGSKIKLDR